MWSADLVDEVLGPHVGRGGRPLHAAGLLHFVVDRQHFLEVGIGKKLRHQTDVLVNAVAVAEQNTLDPLQRVYQLADSWNWKSRGF